MLKDHKELKDAVSKDLKVLKELKDVVFKVHKELKDLKVLKVLKAHKDVLLERLVLTHISNITTVVLILEEHQV